jgi:hypothetical protein
MRRACRAAPRACLSAPGRSDRSLHPDVFRHPRQAALSVLPTGALALVAAGSRCGNLSLCLGRIAMLPRKKRTAARSDGAVPAGAVAHTARSCSESGWSRFLRALLRALAAFAA